MFEACDFYNRNSINKHIWFPLKPASLLMSMVSVSEKSMISLSLRKEARLSSGAKHARRADTPIGDCKLAGVMGSSSHPRNAGIGGGVEKISHHDIESMQRS